MHLGDVSIATVISLNEGLRNGTCSFTHGDGCTVNGIEYKIALDGSFMQFVVAVAGGGGGGGGAVSSVAGKTGTVTLVKSDVGLSNVDNTSDVNKPVSTLQATAIANALSDALGADANLATTVANALAGKAPATGIAQSAVTGLVSDLASKAPSTGIAQSAVTNLVSDLANKAPSTGIAQSAVANLVSDLANKAPSSGIAQSAVANLVSDLAGKAPSTGIAQSAITGLTADLAARTIFVPLTGTAATDAAAINAATLAASTAGGGTVVIGAGSLQMTSSTHRILIYPNMKIRGQGLGTKILAPPNNSTFALFSYEGSGNGVAFSLDDIWLWGYNSDCQALNTKVGTGRLWDVHVGRGVYIDGFGASMGSTTLAVVDIKDPWGLRFSGIIEQCGDRPALRITNNSTSTENAVVTQAKIANNLGQCLIATGCEHLLLDGCIFSTTGSSKACVTIDSCLSTMLNSNYFRTTAASTGQIALDLTGTTTGTKSSGNSFNGQGAATSTAVRVASTASMNVFDDQVKAFTTTLTDNAGDTVARLTTATSELNSDAAAPGLVTARYYKPHYFVGANGTLAMPLANLVYLIPYYVPERTTFTRIGCRVTTGVAASNLRMGIYRSRNGVPTSLVAGSDVGAVASTANGADLESTISCVLSRGWYFLALHPSATISVMSQACVAQSYLIGDTSSTGLENVGYLSPGSFAALPSTAGSVTYSGAFSNNLPVMWLRKS